MLIVANKNAVIVNGTPIREEGRPVTDQLARLPGQVLRSRG